MMITLYQCTIFFSLALLAIIIAVFVFAVSMYKAASELSAKEEEESLKRRKELIKRRRAELEKTISGAEDERLTWELGKKLDRLNMGLSSIDLSILRSRDKAKALTVRHMVSIPASFLLVSIIAAGIALATSGVLQTVMGTLSWVSVAIGVYFIYKNLSAVEFFSRVIDLATLMEQALDRHRMKSIPIPEMDLPDFQLEIRRGNTEEVMYSVSLKQGTIARNTQVRFSATEELDFPEEKKVKQYGFDANEQMKNPKFFWHTLGDINPNVHMGENFKVKVPDQPGEYTMAYWLQCEEYTLEEVNFKINVI